MTAPIPLAAARGRQITPRPPILMPDSMDALLSERAEADARGDFAIRETRHGFELASRQYDWSRRLNAVALKRAAA